ncbi:MATE family efflux transporter [Bradyrhizobium sp. HKCCYLRH3099]|uniref:MATE family efflux transporter n=1 Tax=unclassified Bradyrhizobium TaxID=2631580 RepID=UPI003EB8133B
MTPAPSLRKTFLLFVIPMMLSNTLQSLFGTINNVYLGQMIGVDALAAVSAFFPAMFFFVSFVMGLASGAGILIGQAWGAKQLATVKTVAGAAFAITLALGFAIALGGLFSRELLTALATPANILDAAAEYARVMMISMPLTFVFIMLTALMRGVGDTVTPLIALAVSTALGLVLTPILIRGWFGAPQLGAASAAWASAVSTLLTLGWLLAQLRRRKHPLAIDVAVLRGMRPAPKLLRTVLRLGIPAALSMIVMSLAEMVLIGLVNGFGSDATAAYGAVNQVLGYVQFPALSIAISVSIFGSQAIGRGAPEQMGRIVRTGVEMNLVLTGGLVAIAYLFSRPLMGLFITDPAVIEVAQHSLHLVLWSSVLFGISITFSAAMRASGTVWMPLAISAFAIAAIEVPAGVWLSRSIGLDGVWLAYPIAFTAMMLLQMSYFLVVWRKQTVRRMI